MKNISIGAHAPCGDLCTMERSCVSFNVGPPIKDRVVCELSDSDHTQHPEDLKPRQSVVYRATEVRRVDSVTENLHFLPEGLIFF